VNKILLIQAITDALREDFETLRRSSREARAAGNDPESKAEDKYDTRSTEENYLADGLAKQAQAAADAAQAYENFPLPAFDARTPIDLGALVQVAFPDETGWFFLGPGGGGVEVVCEGTRVTVITAESPLGRQLIGLKAGAKLANPKARVVAVE
jgi:hypothetical protein